MLRRRTYRDSGYTVVETLQVRILPAVNAVLSGSTLLDTGDAADDFALIETANGNVVVQTDPGPISFPTPAAVVSDIFVGTGHDVFGGSENDQLFGGSGDDTFDD